MLLTEYFENTLSKKPYCADDLEFGLRIRPKQTAKLAKHIQFNQPAMAYWLAFDVDSETAGFDWYDCNGPTPNIVIQNPKNGHAHYLFGLEAPVCLSENGRSAPIRYLAGIENGLLSRFKADPGYSGLIVKNPLKGDFWRVFEHHPELYSLDELADYCQAPTREQKNREIRGFGRNVELFDKLRFWAYSRVEQAREGSFSGWLADVTAYGMAINADFSTPLSFTEMTATARSVAKWTWKHYNGNHDGKNRGVLGYGANRATNTEREALTPEEIKERQRAGTRYTNTVRKATTEAKIKEAIAKLTLDGKKPTKAGVARLAGVSRVAISKYYGHLFE